MPGSVFLSDDRVSLHPIETDDEAFCRTLFNEPRVRTSSGTTDPLTAHDEREWIWRTRGANVTARTIERLLRSEKTHLRSASGN